MPRSVIAIPGRPSTGSLLWWFQGPAAEADAYTFELDGALLEAPPLLINLGAALTLASDSATMLAACTYLLVTQHEDGESGAPHKLCVRCKGQASNYAYARTLPHSADGINMVLASCFYKDNSNLLAATPIAHEFTPPENVPHLKMLSGDQIYIDLKWGGRLPQPLEAPWDIYRAQWADDSFLSWMAYGGNLCLPDDHEYWNNYPSENRVGPISAFFKAPTQDVITQMAEAFLIYQATLNADPAALLAALPGTPLNEAALRCFEFPGQHSEPRLHAQFSMFVLDTRTRRTALEKFATVQQFTDPSWLRQVTEAIRSRTAPALLVTSQSLFDRGGGPGGDSNLADYPAQFSELWNAIWACEHELLMLTGDIHWSRAQVFEHPISHIRHFEVVSSALSRIHFGSSSHNLSHLGSQVKWEDKTINALRIADSDEECNYAVLHFSSHDSGLECAARWWGVGKDGRHLPVNMTAGWRADLSTAFRFSPAMNNVVITLH